MLLTSLFRRSLENPSCSLSDPDDWVYDAFGAGGTTSGVRVNQRTALRYGPLFKGVRLFSQDVAKLPFDTYKRLAIGKEKDPTHPAYTLLKHAPNEQQSAYTFKQMLTAHALLRGNGYAYIFRNGDGSPRELLPLLPDQTWPIRRNGEIWYVTQVRTEERKLPACDVLHIRGFTWDGMVGLDLIEFMANAIGLGLAGEEYSARYYKNNAEPAAVIQHPGQLSTTAAKNLRESWNAMHQGLTNAHKVAILEEGMTINPFGVNARQAQLLETRSFQLIDIANFLGIPAHKIGCLDKVNYNSLEQENQSYLDEGLDPWLCTWEHEARTKLLTEKQKSEDSHLIEFNRNALVRADIVARGTYYTQALMGGWKNRDEIRAAENDNPIPDGAGAEYFVPLNMAPASATAPTDPAADPPADPRSRAVNRDAHAQYNAEIAKRSRELVYNEVRAQERAEQREALRQILRDTLVRMEKRVTANPKKRDEHHTVIVAALAPILTAAAVPEARAHAAAFARELTDVHPQRPGIPWIETTVEEWIPR